ncbi:MAG TPA: hypothetical protein VL202_10135 [Pararhizobium sp.]|uniref:hypothetical protein n=1 Tax=Pararhizobium sp. TaxID=1977563 RepID=UPI002C5636B6|nr:hypothetical protein [Pararhizobium sp.]HTO31518.1 hypothetical protein [Pararhizobium sp.]
MTFAKGDTIGRGTVLRVDRYGDRLLVLTDRTPVHPVSFRWPDQAADTGTLSTPSADYNLVDALTGLVNTANSELVVGDAAKALGRVGDEWVSVVCHLLDPVGDELPVVGEEVVIKVDAQKREQLSIAHTAVHLSALALNRAVARFWTKEGVPTDSLGSPDFDKEAIERSLVHWEGSKDDYRLGKSLRKKGFDAGAALSALEAITEEINRIVADWLSQASRITIEPSETTLGSRRLWRCELDGRSAEIFCGGTHVQSLGELGSVTVELTPAVDGFSMTTRATRAA